MKVELVRARIETRDGLVVRNEAGEVALILYLEERCSGGIGYQELSRLDDLQDKLQREEAKDFAPLLPNCPVCGQEMRPFGKSHWRRRGEASYHCKGSHDRADKIWRESDLIEACLAAESDNIKTNEQTATRAS